VTKKRSLFANCSACKKMAERCYAGFYSAVGGWCWRSVGGCYLAEELTSGGCIDHLQPSSNKGPVMGSAVVVLSSVFLPVVYVTA